MHDYSTNLSDRSRVIYWQAVLAVAVFLVLGSFLNRTFDLPYYLDVGSVGGVFALAYATYDRYLWRWVSKVPDLNGTYTGTINIQSGVREEEGTGLIPCWARIEQRWSKICITFGTEFTTSRSSMAVLSSGHAHPNLNGLHYEYHVEPRSGKALEGMGSHSGLARLWPVDSDWRRLEGDFYNDQRYHRFGDYQLTRTGEPVSLSEWLERTAEADTARSS